MSYEETISVNAKNFECAICFDRYSDEHIPYFMNCGHTYCYDCINKISECSLCKRKKVTTEKNWQVISALGINCGSHEKANSKNQEDGFAKITELVMENKRIQQQMYTTIKNECMLHIINGVKELQGGRYDTYNIKLEDIYSEYKNMNIKYFNEIGNYLKNGSCDMYTITVNDWTYNMYDHPSIYITIKYI